MLATTLADLELNSDEVTHCHQSTGLFSVLDLSVCSPEVYLDFWQISEDLCGSDHCPISPEDRDHILRKE